MAQKKKKGGRTDYFAGVNRRRISTLAPNEDLKKKFKAIAAKQNRTPANLLWHLISEHMAAFEKKQQEPVAKAA
jgi:hypothetical protein